MGKTSSSNAGPNVQRGRALTAGTKAKPAIGAIGQRSAAARFAELKRRLREMADHDAGGKADTNAGRARAGPAGTTAKAAARATAQPRGNRKSSEPSLAELKRRLSEISDINGAAAVLGWDQATYMPKGGAAARARQGATLSRLAHEKFTDAALGRLLDGLAAYAERLPETSDDARLIRVVRRDYDKATKVPADFVARWSEHGSASYDAWTRARPANEFATMRPFLEKGLEFSRAYAEFMRPYDHIADPLIDELDEGMMVADVRELFSKLRAQLVPMVRSIAEQPVADVACLRGHFPESKQLEFGILVIKRFGYDLERGRLDKTHHPFCTKFSSGDVRITTRVKENDLGEALFSTLHEAGHGLYEQGVDAALEGTRLGSGTSMGVHESQSRLWENVVGRSRGFWEHFYPRLCDALPEQFRKVPLEAFYLAINKVERSLIRTDADEVTYNLHIMLRFELELDLLEGRLKVKDLPEAWRARFEADFGLTPPDDRDGCLQDVHWYAGGVGGAFQSYAIGNILSAQFYAAALKTHPEISDEMTRGEFGSLHGWLKRRLYRHGRKFKPDEIVRRATGKPMSIKPYIEYLRAKYGELYRLPPVA